MTTRAINFSGTQRAKVLAASSMSGQVFQEGGMAKRSRDVTPTKEATSEDTRAGEEVEGNENITVPQKTSEALEQRLLHMQVQTMTAKQQAEE